MKSSKHILRPALLLAALCEVSQCQAQSTYYFDNFYPDAPVFDASGSRLFGPNYVAVLYGGVGQDSLQLGGNLFTLTPMSPVPFTFMRNGLPGYFSGAAVEVNSMPPGGFAWLQVRVWDALLGATYDDAVKQGLGGYGESNLFYARGGDPTTTQPGLPEPLFGLQSFSLLAEVPEPNSLLLLLLGLPLLLVSRGRSK